jgi:hypothetical protein
MSVPLPADHTVPDPPAPPARLVRPANGRPFGQRIRVPNYLLMNKSMTTVLDLLG